jgi:glucan 1,3-beta-glucosidase
MPKDPREAKGTCQALGAALQPFNGSYAPWQTGTPSSIPASSSASYPWPPPTISNIDVAMQLLPTYTNTGPIATLAPETYTAAPASVTKSVDGWFNAKDTEKGITTVSGCPYPDEWFGVFSVTPTAPCTGSAPTGA